MKATPEQITNHPFIEPGEAFTYIIDSLGVHPDAKILEPEIAATAIMSGLSERQYTSGSGHTQSSVAARYLSHQKNGSLPDHLNTSSSFIQRYTELVGATSDMIAGGEVATTIAQNRLTAAQPAQQEFEYRMARFGQAFLANHFAEDYNHYLLIKARTTFSTEQQHGEGTLLTTGDGLQQQLPRNHAGIVQCAPIMYDTLARLDEMAQGTWDNVALLNSTHFSEGLAHNFLQKSFRLAHKRLFATGDGIAAGIEMLQDEKQGNKRIKKGFGAIILSDVRHRPVEDIYPAITAAPELLAKGGVLAISELDSFQDGKGSVSDLINRAKEAFGADPLKLGPLTIEGGPLAVEEMLQLGQQAIFIKR